MPKTWRQRVSQMRHPGSNRQLEEDSPSNTSSSAATADASLRSQFPISKHTTPVVHTVDPGDPTSRLPIEPPLPPPRSLPSHLETGVLLRDQVDLWDEAYKKLTREQPKLFEHYKSCVVASEDKSTLPAPVNLDRLDSEQREQYLASQIDENLKTIQEQEWSTAGDVYRKIVEAVLFAKDFVGQAVSLEPHAALAWAGVSMLLPVSGQSRSSDNGVVRSLFTEKHFLSSLFLPSLSPSSMSCRNKATWCTCVCYVGYATRNSRNYCPNR
jgi:hypothetical protein